MSQDQRPSLGSRLRDAWGALTGTKAGPGGVDSRSEEGATWAYVPGAVPGQPVQADVTLKELVDEGYDASAWVDACVAARVQAMVSVPWRVEQRVGHKRWEVVEEETDLERIWEDPNPDMSAMELQTTTFIRKLLCGNAILQKARDSQGAPMELWPVSPDDLRPVPGANFIDHWQVMPRSVPTWQGRTSYPREDIIHFRMEDPINLFWGRTPLRSATRAVDTDKKATEWNWAAMQNRVNPTGMLLVKGEFDTERYARIKKLVKDTKEGPKNARRLMVLDGEVDFKSIDSTSLEFDFTEGRKQILREICAVYRVPPPIIGILDDATYSNFFTAQEVFWRNTVIPDLDAVMDTLNRGFRREPRLMGGRQLRLAYDLTTVPALADAVIRKMTAAQQLFSMGVPFNVIDQKLDLGFGPQVGGDIGYVGGGLTPVGVHTDAGA